MIVDDHPVVRQGLKTLLQLEEDLEIAGEADNGTQAIKQMTDVQPDVMLLDLKMPGMDGLATLQTLQMTPSKTKVIMLTALEEQNDWVRAMKLGCWGVVSKQTQPDLIAKSIRKVHSGEIWLDSRTTAAVIRQFADGTSESGRAGDKKVMLSAREKEIVSLVAQGFKNKEMAEKLYISEQTVKNHLHNIFEKLGVTDRLELALYAIHNNLYSGEAA